MKNPYATGAQALALADLDEIGRIIRDQIIDRLMEMPDLDDGITVENVHVDYGNVVFDLHHNGEPTGITRMFSWSVGRYANGEP